MGTVRHFFQRHGKTLLTFLSRNGKIVLTSLAHCGRSLASLLWFFAKKIGGYFWYVLAAILGGVTLGIVIGLSHSPVIAATISGVLGLIGVFLTRNKSQVPIPSNTLILPDATTATAGRSAECSHINLFIPLSFLFLGFLFGLFAGIFSRVNNILHVDNNDIRRQYKDNGFNDAQINAIMNNAARMASGSNRNLYELCTELGFSDQQSHAIVERIAKNITLHEIGEQSFKQPVLLPAPQSPQPGSTGIFHSKTVSFYSELQTRILALPKDLVTPEDLMEHQTLKNEIRNYYTLLDYAISSNGDHVLQVQLRDYLQALVADGGHDDHLFKRKGNLKMLEDEIKKRIDKLNSASN